MPKKLTQTEFLAKAVAVHGVGRYDYSQTAYRNSSGKIAIGCLQHGLFEQRANQHLYGNGCPSCGKKVRVSGLLVGTISKSDSARNTFIARAIAIHGLDKYEYSQAVYKSSACKVKILCKEHGEFEQTPASHISAKSGCPKCAVIASSLMRSTGSEAFIESAKQIHDGKNYDYSLVEYKNTDTNVIITCPTHGYFLQAPNNHLNGAGCPKCARAQLPQSKRLNNAEFIRGAKNIHGDTYDYSLVNYTLSQKKVDIICREHGVFQQAASSHKSGRGCPGCKSKLAKELAKISWCQRARGRLCTLYLICISNKKEKFFKVGVTFRSIELRYKAGVLSTEYEYEVLAKHKSFNAESIYDWEQSILHTFAHLRYRPKNRFDGETECFSEADPILAIFPL